MDSPIQSLGNWVLITKRVSPPRELCGSRARELERAPPMSVVNARDWERHRIYCAQLLLSQWQIEFFHSNSQKKTDLYWSIEREIFGMYLLRKHKLKSNKACSPSRPNRKHDRMSHHKLNGSKVTAAMCKVFQRVSFPFLSSPSKSC